MVVRFRDRKLWLGVQTQKDVMVQARTQEVRTQMVVRFRDRRLWLGVQKQKDVRVQARKEGKDADGCEVQVKKVVAGSTDAEGCEVQPHTGGRDADGCDVHG